MKMKIVKDDVLFEAEHAMDFFKMGIIAAKYDCSVRWVNNEVTGIGIKVGLLVKALSEGEK